MGVLLAAMLSCAPAWAGTSFQSGGGSTAANFQKIGLGGRPTGMGDAFAAVADDVNAIHWNPAGLASLSDVQLTFLHVRWMMQVAHEYLAYAQPLAGSGGIGLSAGWIHTSGVKRVGWDALARESFGSGFVEEGEVSGSGLAFTFAYGNRLDNLVKFKQPLDITFGLAMKVLAERLDTETDFAVGADLGGLWLVNEWVSFGAVFQNLGAGSTGYLLPITMKLAGAVYKRNLALPRDKLTLAGDAIGFIETSPKFHLGAEYRWALGRSALMARVGYRFVEDLGFIAGLTLGVGVDIFLGGLSLQLDYAYVKYGELGPTHRMGVTLRI